MRATYRSRRCSVPVNSPCAVPSSTCSRPARRSRFVSTSSTTGSRAFALSIRPISVRPRNRTPCRLLPAREFPTSAEAIARFRSRWRERFEGDPQQCAVYRAVSTGIVPAGIEAWLPLFFDETTALTDHLPAGSTIVDLADLERSLPLAWAEVGERHEQRRHDRERPLIATRRRFRSRGVDARRDPHLAAGDRHAGQGRTVRRSAAFRQFRHRAATRPARRRACPEAAGPARVLARRVRWPRAARRGFRGPAGSDAGDAAPAGSRTGYRV